jgi:hypothetical protein
VALLSTTTDLPFDKLKYAFWSCCRANLAAVTGFPTTTDTSRKILPDLGSCHAPRKFSPLNIARCLATYRARSAPLNTLASNACESFG